MATAALEIQTPPTALLRGAILFPRHYAAYITLACVDVILTWYILRTGGWEINAIAAWAIELAGDYGMTALKFLCVAFVLVVCEVVGRKKTRLARALAWTAVLVNCVPPAFAAAQWFGLFTIAPAI
ncbi:MAG: DUF5658 family protein [Planctomycetota bacterium]